MEKYRLIEYENYGVKYYLIQKLYRDLFYFLNKKTTWDTIVIRDLNSRDCSIRESLTELAFLKIETAEYVFNYIVNNNTIDKFCIEAILGECCNIDSEKIKILRTHEV